jgi:hypothetical protein
MVTCRIVGDSLPSTSVIGSCDLGVVRGLLLQWPPLIVHRTEEVCVLEHLEAVIHLVMFLYLILRPAF